MKILLSKTQWEQIGQTAGWLNIHHNANAYESVLEKKRERQIDSILQETVLHIGKNHGVGYSIEKLGPVTHSKNKMVFNVLITGNGQEGSGLGRGEAELTILFGFEDNPIKGVLRELDGSLIANIQSYPYERQDDE